MTSTTPGIAQRAAATVVLVDLLCVTGAAAQGLQVLSARGEIYALGALECFPAEEVHRLSPPSATLFSDSGGVSFYGCDPEGYVGAGVEQIANLSSDSLYIHELANTDLGGAHTQAAQARSDVVYLFRVDAGRRLKYSMTVEEYLRNPGPGPYPGTSWARASFLLTRVPSGAVVESYASNAGPGPPTVGGGTILPQGTLDAGDYKLEAHTSAASFPPSGYTVGEFWLRLKVRDVPTAVTSSSWGLVKSRYR